MRRVHFDFVVRVPIRDEQVLIAIVVIIEELYAPAAHELSRAADSGCTGHVVEGFVVSITINGVHLLIDVGNEQVLPAILIEVRGVDAHARSSTALLAECNTGGETNFFKLAVAAVSKEKILDCIVRDKKIHPTVIVDICRDDSPRLAENFTDARLHRYVCECTVAVVVEEQAARRWINTRNAVKTFARALISAELVLRFIELDEPANEQIEFAIVVIVKPDGTGRPTRRGKARFFSHVGERSVTVVAIENISAVLSHIKIGQTVAVVISDRDAHAVATASDARLVGNVSESSVSIVSVERISQRRTWIEEVALAAIHKVDVHPAVVVVIEKCAAGAGGFG